MWVSTSPTSSSSATGWTTQSATATCPISERSTPRCTRSSRDMTPTALRICPLCEATCGLTLTISDGRVTGSRGDRDDVFSAGFICPKGASFAQLDNDPDRLAQPMVRRDGVLTEATWDEAFAVVADRLGAV